MRVADGGHGTGRGRSLSLGWTEPGQAGWGKKGRQRLQFGNPFYWKWRGKEQKRSR